MERFSLNLTLETSNKSVDVLIFSYTEHNKPIACVYELILLTS
jgi:hypothetical protein